MEAADPYIMGTIPGDPHHYGAPLHASPDHNCMEHPMYAADDLWHFKAGADEVDDFDCALVHIHNCSLVAEVLHFRRASALANQYVQEVQKLEERMWEVGQLKEASVLSRPPWMWPDLGYLGLCGILNTNE